MRCDLTDKPPMSRTDKLCLMAIAGLMVLTTVVYELTDGRAIRAAEADKPPAEITWEAPVDQPRLLEAITLQLEEDHFREDVPLDRELQEVLWEECGGHNVPVHLALGLIETESGFDPDADNGLCYGLCQLNKRYFPDGLSPEDNLRAGVGYLGELLERYGDAAAALTAYNLGSYKGVITDYAKNVLKASEKWVNG